MGNTDGMFETAAATVALFDAYDAQVVKPRVAAAGTSCAAGRLALETILVVERQLELLGLAERFGYQQLLGNLFEPVASVCFDEEFALCKNEHIVQRLIPVRLRRGRSRPDRPSPRCLESSAPTHRWSGSRSSTESSTSSEG